MDRRLMIALIIIVTVVIGFFALIGYIGSKVNTAFRESIDDLESYSQSNSSETDSLISVILSEVDTMQAVRWDDSLHFLNDVHRDFVSQVEGLFMGYSLASKIPGTTGQKDDDSWLGTAPGSHNGRGNGFAHEISLQWEAWTLLANRMNRTLITDTAMAVPKFTPLRAEFAGKTWEEETFRGVTFNDIPDILSSIMEGQHARMQEEMYFFQEAVREWNDAQQQPDS